MPNRMEEAMSKGAGKVKAAVARVKGLTGVFNHLAEEHTEADVLLKRAMAASEPSKRRDVWSKLRKELLSHERAELQVVFPELERHAATREIAERHSQEAQELEEAIDRVDQSDIASDTWHHHLAALGKLVKDHVEEEEDDFFPVAQRTLEQSVVRDLKPRFEQAKKSIMQSI